MITPAEAESAIAAALPQPAAEVVALGACHGRVLAEALRAERDAPPFDRVAMDGVALAAADYLAGCRRFQVRGIQAAGAPRDGVGRSGDCLEAMTGAILPMGCDAVVAVEQLRVADGVATLPDGLDLAPGTNVHLRGSDARAGELVLAPGARLGAPEVAIVASTGRERVAVWRRPRIAIASTGDELVAPGQVIQEHQVRRSNPQAAAAALALAGFGVGTDRHLRDDPGEISRGLGELLATHDVLVLSGGVSAGRYDHVPAALESLGVHKIFHRIAQRPGQPMWFGVGAAGQLVFALPGNPVSVLACLARYVRPALAALAGDRTPARTVRLGAPVTFRPALAYLLPVALEYDGDGNAWARPMPTRGSGDFQSLAGTDGIVELPPGPLTCDRGTRATLYPW